MSDPFSDRYWMEEFQVTEADLDRIAEHIWKTNQAYNLTALAKRVVRGRLRYGPEKKSTPAQPTWAPDPSVRLWDPALDWKEGDHVIVAHRIPKTDVFEALVGEIVAVEPEAASMHLDGVEEAVTYRRVAPGSKNAIKWHTKVKDVIAQKRKASNLDEQVDGILLTHSNRIGSQLLEALLANKRFVRLAGRWFLREMVAPPSEAQLAALAWAIVPLEEPTSTADLVPRVAPALVEGDAGLFGLYLAMRERPELFENADPGQRPRWVLAGPPPDASLLLLAEGGPGRGSATPRHAAYDPETYEVLCLPGRPIAPEMVERLWDLELLGAVV